MLSFLSALCASCTNMFFQPSREFAQIPFPDDVKVEDVWIRGTHNTLHSWLISPRDKDCRAIILFFHGNAENISTHSHGVAWLAPHGYCVLAPDYQGYGKSAGEPDIDVINKDAGIILDQAIARAESIRKPLIVFGQSLGGAIAIHAVATSPQKSEISGLIIESSFYSYRKIAREKMAEYWLTWIVQPLVPLLVTDRYSPDHWIKDVSPVPLLVMHGENDRIVPIHHGQSIYENAGAPKEFWKTSSAGHISSFNDPAIRRKFLQYLSGLSRSKDPQ